MMIALAIREAIGRLIRRKPTQSKNADPPDGDVTFWHGGTASGGDPNLFWDNTNKRLGIGTASPNNPLEVYASDTYIQITSTSSTGHAGFNLNNTGTGGHKYAFYDYTEGNFYIGDSTAGANRLSILSNGNVVFYNSVGIGTTTPQSKLQVAGDVLPDQDNSRNCGNNSYRWALVRAQNVICGDLGFEETKCPVDGKPFKPGDEVTLVVKAVTRDGISCAPVHSKHKIDSRI
jgi:hypothetical protein